MMIACMDRVGERLPPVAILMTLSLFGSGIRPMRGLSGLRLHYLLCGRRCQAWDPDVLGRTLESMSVSAVGNLPPLPAARRPPIAAQGCYPSCPERRCSGVAAVTARSHLGARGRSPTLEASAAVAASGGRAAEASKGR